MAVFTIQAPDGRKIDIEAENEAAAVQGAQAFVSANPPGPVEDGGWTLGNVSRAFTRGLPFVGGLRDEAAAGVQSALFGRDYDETLAKERAKDKAFHTEHPVGDFALGGLGGVAGTVAALPAVGGAGVLGAAGRTALGVGARTLPGNVARGMMAGTLQGAASGAGNAEGGFVDRAMGGLEGAAIGGTIGGLVPVGVEGVRRGGAKVLEKITGRGDALSDLSAAARRYIGQISAPTQVAGWLRDLAGLGPEGTLADVSPEWQMVARGAAARPGSRETVVKTLNDRNAGSNARLKSDIDTELGPAVIPSRAEAELDAARKVVGKEYETVFSNARAVPTQDIADQVDTMLVDARGPSHEALSQVREWLNIPGAKDLDPNPRAIHQVRRAIDGLMDGANNRTVIHDLKTVRNQIDDVLANAVPGIKAADAKYAALKKQSEALERGQRLLDTGRESVVRPEELADDLAQSAAQTATGLKQGLRAEVDRVVGTNGNDARAIQRAMRGTEEAGDWNPRKMGMIFGEDPARRALGAVNREVTFQNTANRVTGGSDTAPTRSFQQFLDRAENPATGGALNDLTAFGASVKAARGLGAMLMGELGKARANRYATELARVSIAQGVSRDEFIAALQQAGVSQQRIGQALDYATRAGLIGSREAPRLLPNSRD